jgi:hypothetical protein
MLKRENRPQITKQIITILEAILKQNYFEFQSNIYQLDKGVSMGSLISGTIAEIFPTKHRKHTHKTSTGHKKHNLLHEICR